MPADAQKPAKMIESKRMVVMKLMRMGDSDRLCAGKVWAHFNFAHKSW